MKIKGVVLVTFSFFSFYLYADHTDEFFAVASCLEKELPPSLYAPWRDSYGNQDGSHKPKECPFCREMYAGCDDQFFILKRFKYNLVALNLFPYAKGHLLVIPFEHTSHLKYLSPAARSEMIEIANLSLEILEAFYGIAGANIGYNIGEIAGASLPDHVHMHIVPRSFKSSFMQIIGKTAVAMCDLHKVYAALKPLFDNAEL